MLGILGKESKHVAATPDVADAACELGKGLQFATQTQNVHVQTSIEGVKRPKQNGANEKFATAHFVRSQQKKTEDLKFCCAQRELRFSVKHFAGFRMHEELIDHYRSDGALQTGLGAGATRNSTHPGKQLAKTEWLGKVIISSYFQAHNTIGLIAASGDDDDRYISKTMYFSNEVEATVVWQADVEQNHGNKVAAGNFQCPLACMHATDDPAVLYEKARKHPAQVDIVVHDQDVA